MLLPIYTEVSPNTCQGMVLKGINSHANQYAEDVRTPVHTDKAKSMCSLLLDEFWRYFGIRTVSQCFSCLQLSLSKASAKIRRTHGLAKFFFCQSDKTQSMGCYRSCLSPWRILSICCFKMGILLLAVLHARVGLIL